MRAALATLVCCLAGLALAGPVSAAPVFTVDSIGDQTDATVGDEICKTALGTCTLRAAIEETNAVVGIAANRVSFGPLFNGEKGDTIVLGSPLPPIEKQGPIDGGAEGCTTEAGPQGPCVGVEGPPGETAFTIARNLVSIRSVAITGAGTAVEVLEGWDDAGVVNDWIGVGLDGSEGPNGTGVVIGPDTFFGKVLNSVIAYNEGAGLVLLGARQAEVRRNYFGVLPGSGTVAAPNGTDIEVADSTASEKGAAGGNLIGGSNSVSTSACDNNCNLIAGGIDLSGSGPGQAPASGGGSIRGNYIGLDATGAAAFPHAGPRIDVGQAGGPQIGGVEAFEGNFIVGGSAAVLTEPGSEGLRVESNQIGYDWSGAPLAPPSEVGIRAEAPVGTETFLTSTRVRFNRIRVPGATAIEAVGPSTITGNEISGGEVGISLDGGGSESSLIEANELEGQEEAGVRVLGGTSTLIGPGTAKAAKQNSISGSAGDAVEILGEGTEAEVTRNTGSGNAGLFIDVGGDGPGNEPSGPNDGIQPPGFVVANQNEASGTARPGAAVRLFSNPSASPGELQTYLGTAEADGAGNWTYVFEEPVSSEVFLAATQAEAGRSSELAVSTVEADLDPPQTTVAERPPFLNFSDYAEIEFGSDEAGSFECSFDFGPWAPCDGAEEFEGLKNGLHVMRGRAVDRVGNVDPTPAYIFFIVIA